MSGTLLLDRSLWDLTIDVNGNIAMATIPYASAQDAASAIKLFQGELWYDNTLGVPYFNQILGQSPPVAFMKAQFVKAALRAPDVVAAVCFIDAITNRAVTGQVQVTDSSGTTSAVALAQDMEFSNEFDEDFQ